MTLTKRRDRVKGNCLKHTLKRLRDRRRDDDKRTEDLMEKLLLLRLPGCRIHGCRTWLTGWLTGLKTSRQTNKTKPNGPTNKRQRNHRAPRQPFNGQPNTEQRAPLDRCLLSVSLLHGCCCWRLLLLLAHRSNNVGLHIHTYVGRHIGRHLLNVQRLSFMLPLPILHLLVLPSSLLSSPPLPSHLLLVLLPLCRFSICCCIRCQMAGNIQRNFAANKT